MVYVKGVLCNNVSSCLRYVKALVKVVLVYNNKLSLILFNIKIVVSLSIIEKISSSLLLEIYGALENFERVLEDFDLLAHFW
jgi:hypothetical protein